MSFECLCAGGLKVHKRAVAVGLFVEVICKMKSLSILTWSCFLFTLILL